MKLEQRDLSRLLETAIVAARLAGQRAMEEIRFITTSVKSGEQLVTQADTLCQKIIIDRIKETYPDHGFIAEEGPQGKIFKQQPRSSDGLWWIIDPIDGTNNFAHKVPIFTISIAAMYQDRPVVGVIFEPSTDSMFTAVKDGYAQLNARRITAGKEQMTPFASVSLDSYFDERVSGCIGEIMRRSRFRNLGTTSLHFACVAMGGFIAAIVCRPKLWDIAPGALIVQAAGAVVTDWNGKGLFPVNLQEYNGEELPAIAANKKVHTEILELLKPQPKTQ
ncbi:MAG: inositol monophosphatase [Sedimentisphaerales bacterium]|nr:inositol monophosphatase [Sedimentisphaerales bacterium]